MQYDVKIERHQVVQVALENKWGRRAAPYFDYFHRCGPGGDLAEVQVFYSDGGRLNSAAIINHAQRTQVPAGPGRELDDVLGWLSQPAHP